MLPSKIQKNDIKQLSISIADKIFSIVFIYAASTIYSDDEFANLNTIVASSLLLSGVFVGTGLAELKKLFSSGSCEKTFIRIFLNRLFFASFIPLIVSLIFMAINFNPLHLSNSYMYLAISLNFFGFAATNIFINYSLLYSLYSLRFCLLLFGSLFPTILVLFRINIQIIVFVLNILPLVYCLVLALSFKLDLGCYRKIVKSTNKVFWHIFPHSLSMSVLIQSPRIMLAFFSGPININLYATTSQFTNAVIFLTTNLEIILSKKILKSNKPFNQVNKRNFIISMVIATLVLIFSYKLVYNPINLTFILVILLQTCAGACLYIFSINYNFILREGREKTVFLCSTFASALFLILSYLSAQKYGAVGVAFALMSSTWILAKLSDRLREKLL